MFRVTSHLPCMLFNYHRHTSHSYRNCTEPCGLTLMTRVFQRALSTLVVLSSSTPVASFLHHGPASRMMGNKGGSQSLGSAIRRLPQVISAAAFWLSPPASFSSQRLSSSSSSSAEGTKTEEKGGGHSVPGQAPAEQDPELVRVQTMLMEHQKTAARLTAAEEARTLVYYSTGLGVLGTNSQASSPLAGYPASAMVGFAVDEKGRPIFSFSSISTHKQDLLKDPRASFTVASKDFKGLDDGRVSFVGEIKKVPEGEETTKARETYLARHPGHFWVDFGDFDFFRMDTMAAVRYNGGFARFGALEPADYLDAAPDACQPYAAAVMNHMNADHSDATKAMVLHYVGLEVDKAEIVSLDRLGMMVKVESKWGGSKIRLPFTRECTDRKVCKEIIVEMTQASAGASAGAKV